MDVNDPRPPANPTNLGRSVCYSSAQTDRVQFTAIMPQKESPNAAATNALQRKSTAQNGNYSHFIGKRFLRCSTLEPSYRDSHLPRAVL